MNNNKNKNYRKTNKTAPGFKICVDFRAEN